MCRCSSFADVVTEKVQDGVTGELREIQYTQCKIVGNGSFGVVFQTRLAPSGEDAAIKRVLQDKRFKVGVFPSPFPSSPSPPGPSPTNHVNDDRWVPF